MASASESFEQLFSYGNLQDSAVQRATFGRLLSGAPDELRGYRAAKIEIADKAAAAANGAEFYLNARFTGAGDDVLAGTRLDVTPQELAQADVYEAGARYGRIKVHLASGLEAWVYVSMAALAAALSKGDEPVLLD